MEKVSDYVLVQNLIPNNLCKELIIETSKPDFKWSQHAWHTYGRDDYTSEKTKELEIVSSTQEQFQKLGKYLGEALRAYQEKYRTQNEKTGNGFIHHISQVRFNKYTPGTKMREHYDHIHSLFDGKIKGVPILSIVGLLNDNYEGGQFMMRGEEVKLTRGDILVFPSNFMYPHQVKDITKGIRFSFVSWAF
tara:strand:- start:841 stop:1413 length:573 start_codon:yes stop_codon:yes gene_type:complete